MLTRRIQFSPPPSRRICLHPFRYTLSGLRSGWAQKRPDITLQTRRDLRPSRADDLPPIIRCRDPSTAIIAMGCIQVGTNPMKWKRRTGRQFWGPCQSNKWALRTRHIQGHPTTSTWRCFECCTRTWIYTVSCHFLCSCPECSPFSSSTLWLWFPHCKFGQSYCPMHSGRLKHFVQVHPRTTPVTNRSHPFVNDTCRPRKETNSL